MGGYYGAKLARSGQRVTFVARGAHLAAIRERGLAIWSSALGDFVVQAPAESDTQAIGPVDVVILAVKTYDNDTALPMLKPLLGPDTVVLTLQNGVSSVEEVAAVVGERAVLGGATYVATAIRAPGIIEQTGTNRRIAFGEVFGDCQAISERVAKLSSLLEQADIQAETHANGRVPLWQKFIYLSPFAGITGASRLPAGWLWGDPDLRQRFLAASAEVEAVARAEGIRLPDDLHDRLLFYMNTLPPSVRSSLLIDLSQEKRIEVEALHGDLVRRARRLGVPVPVIETLYAVLKPYAKGTPPLTPA